MQLKFILLSISLAQAISHINNALNEQDTDFAIHRDQRHHPYSLYNPSLHPIQEHESFTNLVSTERHSDLEKLINFFNDEGVTEILTVAAQREKSLNGILVEAIRIAVNHELDSLQEVLETHPLAGAVRLLSGWEDEDQHHKIFLYLKSIANQIKRPVSDEWLLRMAVIESYRLRNRTLRNLLLKHQVNTNL